MKMKNWLKTTLAIGLVAATSTAFVGCGGAAAVKGDPISYSEGATAYANANTYTGASVTKMAEDAGFTMDFNAYIKDFGAGMDANIDAQFIGSGKKSERVYQLTIDPRVSFGSMFNMDVNVKLTAADYGTANDKKVIFYDEGSKQKLDLTPITNLINTVAAKIASAQIQEQTQLPININSQMISQMLDIETVLSMLLSGISTNTLENLPTEAQYTAANQAAAEVEAAAGNYKSIMGAEFRKANDNTYSFKITQEVTSWAQKEGTTAATDLDETVAFYESNFEVTDGVVTKVSSTATTKLNNVEKTKMGYSLGMKYEAKKLTKVSEDKLKEYKDIVADGSLLPLDQISAMIENFDIDEMMGELIPQGGNASDQGSQTGGDDNGSNTDDNGGVDNGGTDEGGTAQEGNE
ncbi:MAG: hypothetical protein IKQ31_03370 [Clostridia bacterium]|nr:hypothetical protein [Clostridia bacterium]